jgi:serine/threonine protein phosphatase PrpC
MSSYRIEAGTGQHIGDRDEQQDRIALLAAPKAPGYMMAVLADGMGGAGGGSIAAEQAVRTAQQVFARFSPLTDDVESMLREIASEIHTVIQLTSMASEIRPQTTLALLVLTPERTAIWGHAGDSRICRFSGPNLAERTIDHTQGEPDGPPPAMRSTHAMTAPVAAARTPTVLVNVLGNPGATPIISIGRHANLQAGDSFLLCTDGLWHYCSESECGAAIAMNTPREAAQMLIRKARDRSSGDADNCTLGIVKLVEPVSVSPAYQIDTLHRAV